MGVYARNHAQQLILDGAIPGEKSNLSPRAQLLLLHIALQFGGDQEIVKRDVTKGTLWNREAVYFEGLGKKARAIGYNTPEKIDAGTEYREEMTGKQVRAVKAAVGSAVKELIAGDFLFKNKRGQTGQTAEYDLKFLRRACSQCLVMADGEKFMDETLHLGDGQREEEFERIGESRGGAQDAEKTGFVPRPKPKKRPVSPWDRLGVHS